VLIEREVAHAIEALVGLPFPALHALNLGGMLLVLAPVTLCEIVLGHALTGRSIEPTPL
jgi:pyridoxine 5'-phosphate synthase PdxJ